MDDLASDEELQAALVDDEEHSIAMQRAAAVRWEEAQAKVVTAVPVVNILADNAMP